MLNHNSKGDLESINIFRAQNRWRSPRVSSGTMKMGMATCVYEDLVRGCKRYIVCYVRIEIQMGGAVVMPWWFQRFFRPRLAQNALQTKDTKAKKDAEGWDCIFQTRETNTKKKRHSKKLQSTHGPIGMPACLLVVVIQVDSLTFVQPTCRGCLFASPAWRVPWRKKKPTDTIQAAKFGWKVYVEKPGNPDGFQDFATFDNDMFQNFKSVF